MTLEVWIIIGIVVVVVWGLIIHEIRTTPVYRSDYINEEEEAELREVPQNEKSPPKSQTHSGTIDTTVPIYKHWTYETTNCPCQMGVLVEEHTKDCTWLWENHGIHYQISELQKRYEELKSYSDISYDPTAQKEYMRLEVEIESLKKSV